LADYQTGVDIEGLADAALSLRTHDGDVVSLSVSGWEGEGTVTLSKENVEKLVAFLESWLARPRA
jgi:hypothetical protein